MMQESAQHLEQSALSTASEALPNVPVEHMDYGYIERCSDSKELMDILTALRSGKEGRWYDLEKFCEKRYIECLPAKEKKLYVAQHTEPSFEDVSKASSDVADFIKSISKRDESLRKERRRDDPVKEKKNGKLTENVSIFEDAQEDAENARADNCERFPPVRGMSKNQELKATYDTIDPASLEKNENDKKVTQRLSGYDFRAWDKFDVEKELKRIEEEEVRLDKEKAARIAEKQAEIDGRKKESEEAKLRCGLPKSLDTMSDEARVYASDREKQKGNECFKAEEFEDALRYYSRSIELLPPNSKDARPFANRAMAFLKLNRWEAAEGDCDEAILRDSSFSKAYARRAMARHRRGHYAAAIEDFEEALHLEPNNSKLNFLLAESRKMYKEVGGIKSGKSQETEEKPEKFKKLMIIEDSDDDEEEDEENEEAEETEKKEESPEEEQVVHPDLAMQVAQEKLSAPEPALDITWVEAKRRGAEEFQNQDFQKALKWFNISVQVLEKLFQSDSSLAEHLCNCRGNVAVCYRELGEWSNVIEECDKVLKISPENIKALFRRGAAHEELENTELALNDMCQVLRLDPNMTEAGERISQLMAALNNPSVKKNTLIKAPTVNKTAPEAPVSFVDYEETPSREAFAPPVIDNVAESERRKDEGNDLFKAGNIQGAIEKYTAALELDRKNVSALSNRAMARLQLQEFEECIKDSSEGLHLLDDLKEEKLSKGLLTKLLYRRASAQKNLGNFLLALEDLEKVAKLEPQNRRAKKELEDVKVILAEEKEKQEAEHKRAAELDRIKKIQSVEAEQARLIESAKAKAAEKMVGVKSFAVPKTSYEFQRQWRSLKLDQRLSYLRSIPCGHFKKLFKVELEDELLMAMIDTLGNATDDQGFITPLLEELVNLDKFMSTVKFLTSSEKEKIRAVVDHCMDETVKAKYSTILG